MRRLLRVALLSQIALETRASPWRGTQARCEGDAAVEEGVVRLTSGPLGIARRPQSASAGLNPPWRSDNGVVEVPYETTEIGD